MASIPSDILLKSFLEYSMNVIRNNLWLISDIAAKFDMERDPLTKVEYGSKYAQSLYDFFLNNKIPVVMHFRNDRATFPCYSIALGSASEKTASASLGDYGHIEDFDPADADVPVYNILGPFNVEAYDPTTGIVTLPDSVDASLIAINLHMLLDRKGIAYVIQKLLPGNTFRIAKNAQFDAKGCVIRPISDAWGAVRKRVRMSETYQIGCHSASNAEDCLFLSALLQYIIVRFKADYLEKRNVELATFNISSVDRGNSDGDNLYSRFFNLSFESEFDVLDSVSPKMAKAVGTILIMDGPKSPQEFQDYIKTASWRMEADGLPETKKTNE